MTPYVSLHLAAGYTCFLAIMRAAPLTIPPTRVLYAIVGTGVLSVIPAGLPPYAWRPVVKFALFTLLFVLAARMSTSKAVSRRSTILAAALLAALIHLELDEFVEILVDVAKHPDHWLLAVLTPVLLVVSYTTMSSQATRFTMMPALLVYAATEAYLQSVYSVADPVVRHALAGSVCVVQLTLFALLFRLPCASCAPSSLEAPRKFISVSEDEHDQVIEVDRHRQIFEERSRAPFAAAAAKAEDDTFVITDPTPPQPPSSPVSRPQAAVALASAPAVALSARPPAVPARLDPPPSDDEEVSLL